MATSFDWVDRGRQKPTSGMKSSSSLGKVTGTLSLVRAHAPTLRIFIETYRDRSTIGVTSLNMQHFNTSFARRAKHRVGQCFVSSPSPRSLCPCPSAAPWIGCSSPHWLWCLGTFLTACWWSLPAYQPYKTQFKLLKVWQIISGDIVELSFPNSFHVSSLASLSHSTMFSSFSLSALVSRINRLKNRIKLDQDGIHCTGELWKDMKIYLVRWALWYRMKTSLFWTYLRTNNTSVSFASTSSLVKRWKNFIYQLFSVEACFSSNECFTFERGVFLSSISQ